MVFKRRNRRLLGGIFIVVGAVLMFLAPESGAGWVLLALALVLELIGLVLERRA